MSDLLNSDIFMNRLLGIKPTVLYFRVGVEAMFDILKLLKNRYELALTMISVCFSGTYLQIYAP